MRRNLLLFADLHRRSTWPLQCGWSRWYCEWRWCDFKWWDSRILMPSSSLPSSCWSRLRFTFRHDGWKSGSNQVTDSTDFYHSCSSSSIQWASSRYQVRHPRADEWNGLRMNFLVKWDSLQGMRNNNHIQFAYYLHVNGTFWTLQCWCPLWQFCAVHFSLDTLFGSGRESVWIYDSFWFVVFSD